MEAIKSFSSSRDMILYALISTLCFITAYVTEVYAIALIPFLLPAAAIIIEYPKIIFVGLFITIPFSRHVPVVMGLSTELFSEQLMWILCLIGAVAFLIKGRDWNYTYLVHPISLILILHLLWTTFATILSVSHVISVKFLLAKMWFVLALYGGGLYFFREKNMWKVFFWGTYLSLMIIVSIIMFKHWQEGFTFQSINTVISPFFSNHVYYAVMIVLFLPFLFIATQWYRRFSLLWWCIVLGIGFFIIATILTYTRAAIIVMAAYPLFYLMFKLKVMKWAMIIGVLLGVVFIAQTIKDNHYLKYAPEYSKTISHDKFGNLIEATYTGKDISTMERMYRWVAAYQMIKENPYYGYGPGTFPSIYKSYRLNMFSTYVSENKEGSGIHNYYLMILVEQGFPGLILFLALLGFVIYHGEKLYHRVRDTFSKQILIAFLVSFVGLVFFNLINDLVEVDKMASYFFWTMVAIILIDFKTFERKLHIEGEDGLET